MTSTFACPECGQRIRPEGVPARQLRCPACATLLEMPFIPRTIAPKRRSRRSARRRAAWLAGSALAGVLLMVIAGVLGTRAAWRRQATREVAAAVQAVETLARAGQFSGAAEAAAAAMELAHHRRVAPPAGLARRRVELAREAARQALHSWPTREPAAAVAAALALRDQARSDPNLAEFLGPIAEALAAARHRVARRDLDAARTALDSAHPADALNRSAAAWSIAGLLSGDSAVALRRQADALAQEVARRHGVVAEPITGQFFLGSAAEYQTLLARPALDALRGRGYVAAPSDPPGWGPLWDQFAPTRLNLEVDEQPIPYFQSANRATKLVVRLALTSHGTPLQAVTLNAQTRTPPPSMAAYEAGVVATAPRRSPAIEQRLRRDALDQILERLAGSLQNVPAP